MMIEWFEDKILASVPPSEESLVKFKGYTKAYAEHAEQGALGATEASLACVLVGLVVECRLRGSSIYGALQSYTREQTKVYYLPNLPLPDLEYLSLQEMFIDPWEYDSLLQVGFDFLACFPLAKRLGIDLEHLLFVAIIAAELLMKVDSEEPIELNIEDIRAKFSL